MSKRCLSRLVLVSSLLSLWILPGELQEIARDLRGPYASRAVGAAQAPPAPRARLEVGAARPVRAAFPSGM